MIFLIIFSIFSIAAGAIAMIKYTDISFGIITMLVSLFIWLFVYCILVVTVPKTIVFEETYDGYYNNSKICYFDDSGTPHAISSQTLEVYDGDKVKIKIIEYDNTFIYYHQDIIIQIPRSSLKEIK